MTVTAAPARASQYAVVAPATPAPTTTTRVIGRSSGKALHGLDGAQPGLGGAIERLEHQRRHADLAERGDLLGHVALRADQRRRSHQVVGHQGGRLVLLAL